MTGVMEFDPAQPLASPLPLPRRPLPPAVNLTCLLLTLFTTVIAGTLLTLDDFSMRTIWDIARAPSYWVLGLPYSLSLLLILGAHEMGHYVACRLYGIDASLPFFIPAPHLFGTFGAVIRIRAPITHRRALFDIGVAGPIAGFVVAIPVLLYGLSRSAVVPRPLDPEGIHLGSCLLLELLHPRFFAMRPGAGLHLDPIYMAAWLGLFATSLNLLPVGQLDGGHMLYALSRRVHWIVSRYGCPLLIVAGLYTGGYHLVTFGIVFTFLGPRHPPLIDEREGLDRPRIVVAVAALAIFILCFIPVPIQ